MGEKISSGVLMIEQVLNQADAQHQIGQIQEAGELYRTIFFNPIRIIQQSVVFMIRLLISRISMRSVGKTENGSEAYNLFWTRVG